MQSDSRGAVGGRDVAADLLLWHLQAVRIVGALPLFGLLLLNAPVPRPLPPGAIKLLPDAAPRGPQDARALRRPRRAERSERGVDKCR